MKCVQVCMITFTLCLLLLSANAQFFGHNFGNYRPYNGYGLNAITGDFGGAYFAGGASSRDPRNNRGPVLFPPPPQDGPQESSGVVAGASGYGFVPPHNT